VPQKAAIDPDTPLRARDVVALGIDGHKLGFPLPLAARRGLVTEALQAVSAGGTPTPRFLRAVRGWQQRVLIAHAVISRPRLLLLDEPLANLDLRSEQGLVSVLARLAGEQQIAVLTCAHDMNPLMRATGTVGKPRRGILPLGQGWPAVRRRGSARRAAPALSPVL
jgi:zinc/manganese transport system ATP-binding protein